MPWVDWLEPVGAPDGAAVGEAVSDEDQGAVRVAGAQTVEDREAEPFSTVEQGRGPLLLALPIPQIRCAHDPAVPA